MDATAVISAEAARLADVLATTDPRRAVPTCPGWTAVDLLWHLAEVHEFWHEILTSGALTDEEVSAIEEGKEPRPRDVQLIAQRRADATAALVAELDRRSDDEAAWFWGPDHTVGSTRRMQVHEATLHRVDAEMTAGGIVTRPTDEVSLAGIDHCVDIMWGGGYAWVPDWATVETVAIAEVDAGTGDEPRRVEIAQCRGSRDGTDLDEMLGRRLRVDVDVSGIPVATVTGSAAALNLWLWGRDLAIPALADESGTIEVSGDPEAVEALGRLVEQGLD